MATAVKIFKDGLETNPKSRVIFGNLCMILMIGLGTIACWYVHPFLAGIYLVVFTILIFIVLRKLVCTNCYYYDKWCGIGWGKLSAKMFKKGNMEDFGKGPILKIAPLLYGMMMFIPMIVLLYSISQSYTIYKVLLMILLIILTIYSGSISRKKGCVQCKMKYACPGSAAK